MTEKKTSQNSAGVFEPFAARDVPEDTFEKGERFASRYRQLGQYGGGEHVGVCLEELDPGKQACPFHYHMLEEEHLLILEGELTLRLGEDRHVMKSGDYVCFPAGQQVGHALINHTEAVCR
ncbi:MAG: cupin domain-containing protein, partial [Gammaproteobacteria bacterium]|nr:cupin domain-containing protein [Gammaproteobacteria bacterium]